MIDLKRIRQVTSSRLSRWIAVTRSHPARTNLTLAALSAASLFAFRSHVSNRITMIGRYLYRVAHAHPFLGTTSRVLINAVPDTAFALLAIAGLAYLVPDTVKALEKKRSARILLILLFVGFGLFAIIVNAVNREEQDSKTRSQDEKMEIVSRSVLHMQDSLSPTATRMKESDRRNQVMQALRAEYIIGHDPIDPEILAGNRMPPDLWMNDRLRELRESWKVSAGEERQIQLPERPTRSYLTFEGPVNFTGSSGSTENSDFLPGDTIAFNYHFRVTGPNAVQLIGRNSLVILEPDALPLTQEAAIAKFLETSKSNRGKQPNDDPDTVRHPYLLVPGQSVFSTARATTDDSRSQLFTQHQIADLRSGNQVVFVMIAIAYRDLGQEHHLRFCEWLQPPALPFGIWNTCGDFPSSD